MNTFGSIPVSYTHLDVYKRQVYYLAPGSDRLVRVTTQPGWDADCWPNGIGGSPDGKKLFVNKWEANNRGGTWIFDIGTDGALSNMRKVIDTGGDGMSMDERGNIYISNSLGVTAFDKQGHKIFNVSVEMCIRDRSISFA